MLIETTLICILMLIMTWKSHRFKLTPIHALPWLWVSIGTEGVTTLAMRTELHTIIVRYTIIIQVIIYLTLLIFIIANIKNNKGFAVFTIGALLNAIAIFSNGGFMPVSTKMAITNGYEVTLAKLQAKLIFGHDVLTAQTRLPLLADWLDIQIPYISAKTISIGDIWIDLGLLFITIGLILQAKKGYREHVD